MKKRTLKLKLNMASYPNIFNCRFVATNFITSWGPGVLWSWDPGVLFSDGTPFFGWHAFFQMARLFSDGTPFFGWHAFFRMARLISDGTPFFRWHAFFQMARLFSDGTPFFRWHANGTLLLHYGTPMAHHISFMARQWHFILLKARMARYGTHGTPFSKICCLH